MKLYSVKMRSSKGKVHISGAERIVEKEKVPETISALISRAFEHPRGSADTVSIKVERLREEPKRLPLLRIVEIKDRERYRAEEIVWRLLQKAGIDRLISLKVYRELLKGPSPSGTVMRGAMVVRAGSGERIEEDSFRGVRATYMDMTESALKSFRELVKDEFNENFRDAVVLSTKVINCRGVLAELCISDDPDYTTGYVSLKGIGYVRIKGIKPDNHPFGGRAFFVDENARIESIRDYMEKEPVIVDRVSSYDLLSFDGVLSL